MSKQQKYRILADLENNYRVEIRTIYNVWAVVYRSENKGKSGLEDCQDWLAKQPEED